MTALRIDHLNRAFGSLVVTDDVSLDIVAGERHVIIGPNGAGKTSLVNQIGGQLKPGSGRIFLKATDITAWSPDRISRLGVARTFQRNNLFQNLSVMENLLTAMPDMRGSTIAGALRGRRYWRHAQDAGLERGYALLERFGLGDRADAYAGELSGGQKRLLEIARAVAANPRMLLLDEPFAGVNPTLARDVESVLIGLRDDGLTMVLVEHDMGAVERLCDDVIVMAEGRAIARGTMAEIVANEEVADAYLGG